MKKAREGGDVKKSGIRRSVAREIAYIALSVSLITVCAWISFPVMQSSLSKSSNALIYAVTSAFFLVRRKTPPPLDWLPDWLVFPSTACTP